MIRLKKVRKYSKYSKIEWLDAPDVKKRVNHLISSIELNHLNNNVPLKSSRIFCFRSNNAKTRAYARIWGFSKIWQKALDQNPAYIIEVISEKFDRLEQFEQDKVLLHELVHIPQNFSGALLPHRRRGRGSFHDKLKKLINAYENTINSR